MAKKQEPEVAPQAWEAICDGEDYGGTVKLFSSREINASVGIDKMWQEKGNEHDEYYASLKEGQTVHYCNGFKEFVECVVVEKSGKNVLQPVAIKGEWRKWDLPYRQPDGLIHLGYHAKMIINKETFTPNYTCIVECPQTAYKNVSAETLANMPRINLEVSPMGARQLQIAGILGVLDTVTNMVDEKRKEVYGDPATDLSEVRKKVAEFLTSSAKHLMLLDERAGK
jgi:hypothetical protein